MIVNRFDLKLEVVDNPFWGDKFSEWENFTFTCLKEFSNKDKSLLDIGSWIGPLSIFNHNNYRNIYSIEPDKIAFDQLKYNVEVNKLSNIKVFNEAIYRDFPSEITIGSECLGNSNTRININDTLQTQKIHCQSLSSFICKNDIKKEDIGFLKIDVEGSELEILKDPFFNDVKFPIYISIHPGFIENFRENLDVLFNLVDKFRSRAPDFNPSINMSKQNIFDITEFYSMLLYNPI